MMGRLLAELTSKSANTRPIRGTALTRPVELNISLIGQPPRSNIAYQ